MPLDSSMAPSRSIKHIGGGVEGEITLVEHPNRGVVILKTRKGKPQISNEANVALTLLQGEHRSRNTICQVFSIEGPSYVMIIEYCEGGDMRHVINQLHSQSYCLGKAFLRHVQLHLGAALVYLHCGIHFDVKTDNIFLRWEDKVDHSSPFPDIVIGDLGNAITERPFLSVFQDEGEIEPPKWSKFCDQNYGPQEFFRLGGGDDIERVSFSSSFDMWQFGATLYELITRIVLNMALQNQNRDGSKARRWIKEEWGKIGDEVMEMTREDASTRMTDEKLAGKLALWKVSRDQEYKNDDGVGKRDFEWLVQNTENHFS